VTAAQKRNATRIRNLVARVASLEAQLAHKTEMLRRAESKKFRFSLDRPYQQEIGRYCVQFECTDGVKRISTSKPMLYAEAKVAAGELASLGYKAWPTYEAGDAEDE